MFSSLRIIAVAVFSTGATASIAGICDYRPSLLTASPSSGNGVAANSRMATAGFYTLPRAVTGMTMLKSTTETVGKIGGTSAIISTTAGLLSSPVVVTGAAIAAVGIGGYEGVCFFKDNRVTEYAAVDLVVKNIGTNANPDIFQYVEGPLQQSRIRLLGENNQWQTYMVANLYLVNGTLMHRDRFRNTTIGAVGFVERD